MKLKNLFLLVPLVFFISTCKEKDRDNGTNYNRKLMLENYADNVIIPSFALFKSEAQSLKTKSDVFLANTTIDNLNALKFQWKKTALAFQKVIFYQFGPAETPTGTLMQNINTFPVNNLKIEDFISANDYSLNNFDRDCRGLMCLDYLLFKDVVQVVRDSFYTARGIYRANYLNAVVNDILQKAEQTHNDWLSYRDIFVNATGTDAGSSSSLLYNSGLMGFEFIKNYKLALPLGARAGQTHPQPELAEALYSEYSLPLIQEGFTIFKNQFYYGVNVLNNNDSEGFDNYLSSIEGGSVLVENTWNQMLEIEAAYNPIDEHYSMPYLINNQNQALTNYYNEFQQLVHFIKSDMSSLLGISITYSSGDGD